MRDRAFRYGDLGRITAALCRGTGAKGWALRLIPIQDQATMFPEGATSADLQGAFRRLAKEHHPDRWHDAPSDVRAEHEAHMALITEAHRELRRRDL